MKYMITATVESVTGWQHYIVVADSKDEALKVYESGGGDFYDEELNITQLRKVTIADIDEFAHD